MRPLCVIPARRGSKRLANKNVLPLAGKPMLVHTIEAATASGVFEQVYVSSEDEEIRSIAEKAGAVAHARPIALAGDLVSATEVCLEVLQSLARAREDYEAVVCLQPTSPLRDSEDVRGSWREFIASEADYLVSVTDIDPHYFHWALRQTDEGWEMYFGDRFMMERPLLPPVCRPNGAIKIGKRGALSLTRNFFGKPLTVYRMPEARSVHVAEQFDFDVAEYLMQRARAR